jgi:ribosomal protein L11 methyltransferase
MQAMAERDSGSSQGRPSEEVLEEPEWTQQYASLSVELPARYRDWLSACLLELGFAAFEEKVSARGTSVVIYDRSRARLGDVERVLCRRAREHSPPLDLRIALGQLGSGWALGWTAHLTPVQLTPSLTAIPQLPTGPRQPSQLFLKPAFAFGFGEHDSTRLVAAWLEQKARERPGCSVLDVGCGTGVLSLVALASGAGRVLGLDTSRDALDAARSNLELNQLEGATFADTPLSQISERFDRVVANIEATILVSLAPSLVPRLGPGGQVALAGFIAEQMDAIVLAYRAAGVELELAARHGAWCLLAGCAGPTSSG